MIINIYSQLANEIRTYVDKRIHKEFQNLYEDVTSKGFEPAELLTVPTTLFMNLQFGTMKQLEVEVLDDGNYLSKYPVVLILKTVDGDVFSKEITVDIKICSANHKEMMYEFYKKIS